MDFKKIENLLTTPKKIIITMHARPDADALGSSLGLAGILKKMGHSVDVIAPTEFPNFLRWLIDADKVILFSGETDLHSQKLFKQAELIFCLDFSSLKRVNNMSTVLDSSKATKIIIDHHIDPENFADIMFIDTEAPATAILIYRLLKSLNLLKYIDSNIADSLYSGILTDTGSFQHPNSTAESHLITAELIKFGANVSEVSRKIYNTNSINKLRFLGFALSNRLVILERYHAAYFYIEKKDFLNFNLKTGDTEGLVNYALSLENINLAALITDKGDFIRLSLRSSGNIAVNEIAKNHFNGGGHKNAAGGKFESTLESAIGAFEDIIKTMYKK
ncbi:MAG: bifunctional oligoribonuclease/PAP phosphatase NrnA [Bacteroidetes bacterium]|nr:bifunctional oligoribonuclease/PAP phosphatase NrnA [Bacteroidota bacterium]